MIGLLLTGLVIVTALVSLVWLPYPLSDISGGRLEGPNGTHLLGTDRLGRDLLSQLMVGARIALIVGAGAALFAGAIGTLVGLAAALARPWVDDTLSATLDVVIAFPVLLLAMLVVAVQGASLGSAIFAIGLAMAAVIARLTRILARRVLQEQFVTAARTSGTRLPGIVGRHILPNIAPTLAVALALQFGVAVLAEASLSYLGLGAPPPNASWGRMLQEAQGTVLTAPVGALAPGIADRRPRPRRELPRRRPARACRPDEAEGAMSLLEVSGLSVHAGADPLVRDVSFSLAPGERLGVIGESGSGKSVTSLAALGLLPDGLTASGSIRLDGHEVVGSADAALRRLRGPVAADRVPGAAHRPRPAHAGRAARSPSRCSATSACAAPPCVPPSPRPSSRSRCPTSASRAPSPTSCPADSASGSPSRSPWPPVRACSSRTSRRRRWT